MKKVVEEQLAYLHTLIKENDKNAIKGCGKCALVLYYTSIFQAYGGNENIIRAKVLLSEIINSLNQINLKDFESLKSISSLSHIFKDLEKKNLLDQSTLNDLDKLDIYLYNEVISLINTANPDDIYCCLEIVQYFIGRLPHSNLEGYLYEIYPGLYNRFLTNYKVRFSLKFNSSIPSTDFFNLGFYNGVSGLLVNLIDIYYKLVKDENIVEIVRKGVLYMIFFKDDVDFSKGKYSMFPDKVREGHKEKWTSNQLSWHSGDLCQSLLFYRVSELLKDNELKKIANLVGLNTLLRKDKDSTNITGANFFNGSSGVSHCYRILFELGQNNSYLDGYEYWINETLKFLGNDFKNKIYLEKEASLLYGLPGIALTLLSYTSEKNLSWSKSLFL